MSEIIMASGIQWGDEGKAKIVDYFFARRNFDLCCRYNGGPNAGNTVIFQGKKIVLKHLPVGVFHNTTNIVGNGCVIDLLTLQKEIAEVEEIRGEKIDPSELIIQGGAHVIMPWHKIMDKLIETFFADSPQGTIGTTGRGIGPCYADKDYRHTATRMFDFWLSPEEFYQKTDKISAYYRQIISSFGDNNFLQEYEEELKKLPAIISFGYKLQDSGFIENNFVNSGIKMCSRAKTIFIQSAHGVMLDKDFGTYPFVTSSNTSLTGLFSGLGGSGLFHQESTIKHVGIMKAYTTRVGNGPFPTKIEDEIGAEIRKRGHEYGSNTGRPRDCGWLDLPQIKYACEVAGITSLAITKLDVLVGLPELKVGIGYRRKDQSGTTFYWPTNPQETLNVIPYYHTLSPIKQIFTCPNSRNSFDDLTEEVRQYIQLIEKITGLQVRIISYGPTASETISL